MKTNGASEGEKARGTSTKEAKFRAHLQVAHLAVTSYHMRPLLSSYKLKSQYKIWIHGRTWKTPEVTNSHGHTTLPGSSIHPRSTTVRTGGKRPSTTSRGRRPPPRRAVAVGAWTPAIAAPRVHAQSQRGSHALHKPGTLHMRSRHLSVGTPTTGTPAPSPNQSNHRNLASV